MTSRNLPHLLNRRSLAGFSVAWCLAASMVPAPAFAQQKPMKIRLHFDDAVATATLEDSVVARDFAAMLPLSVTLKDYAAIERITDLPRKLPTAQASMGMTPVTGDIAYYAPWGNLAIYLSGTVYDRGLVRLGKVDSGLSALHRPAPFTVRIERASD